MCPGSLLEICLVVFIDNLAFHPYGVDKSSTNLPDWGEGRGVDNTVWSHWQVASRSSEVNLTKNFSLLYFF